VGGDLAVLIEHRPSIIDDESDVGPSEDIDPNKLCLVFLGLRAGCVDGHICYPLDNYVS
jgi:hypothetical protein